MTDRHDPHGEVLRRVLHAEADAVMPSPDGLAKIRAGIEARQRRRHTFGGGPAATWIRPALAAAAAFVIAAIGISAPATIDRVTSAGDKSPSQEAGLVPTSLPTSPPPGAGSSGGQGRDGDTRPSAGGPADPGDAASPTDPSCSPTATETPSPTGTPVTPGTRSPCPPPQPTAPPEEPAPTTPAAPGDDAPGPTPTATAEASPSP